MNSEVLYMFSVWFGRMGRIHGLFIADPADVEKAMGGTYNFGEALGKHSEVYGELREIDLTRVTDNEEFIRLFREHGLVSGYNPVTNILERRAEREGGEEDD